LLVCPLPRIEESPGELAPRINDQDLAGEVEILLPGVLVFALLDELDLAPNAEDPGHVFDIHVLGAGVGLAGTPTAIELSKGIEQPLPRSRSAHLVVVLNIGDMAHAQTLGADKRRNGDLLWFVRNASDTGLINLNPEKTASDVQTVLAIVCTH
jgi:hypothetical protein